MPICHATQGVTAMFSPSRYVSSSDLRDVASETSVATAARSTSRSLDVGSGEPEMSNDRAVQSSDMASLSLPGTSQVSTPSDHALWHGVPLPSRRCPPSPSRYL